MVQLYRGRLAQGHSGRKRTIAVMRCVTQIQRQSNPWVDFVYFEVTTRYCGDAFAAAGHALVDCLRRRARRNSAIAIAKRSHALNPGIQVQDDQAIELQVADCWGNGSTA